MILNRNTLDKWTVYKTINIFGMTIQKPCYEESMIMSIDPRLYTPNIFSSWIYTRKKQKKRKEKKKERLLKIFMWHNF